jgi:hypothetical protein
VWFSPKSRVLHGNRDPTGIHESNEAMAGHSHFSDEFDQLLTKSLDLWIHGHFPQGILMFERKGMFLVLADKIALALGEACTSPRRLSD